MKRWPDFVIIGAMKSATSTLHEQLAGQPGLFMSDPKEPNFFSDDEIYARGFDWYESLFADAGPRDLCGESSTHYTKLPTYPLTIGRIQESLPRAKFIYMIRHPIQRLVSHYLHERLEGKMQMPIDEAVRRHPELVSYGSYAMQLEPFLNAFGPDRVLLCFFERFVQHGQEELERICRFLGYEGVPRWIDQAEATNVSRERMTPCGWRDALVGNAVLRALRRTLVPKSFRDWIRSLWYIKERPELSEQTRTYVEELFDADLARLGNWLDLELTCRNFREIGRDSIPEWAPSLQMMAR